MATNYNTSVSPSENLRVLLKTQNSTDIKAGLFSGGDTFEASSSKVAYNLWASIGIINGILGLTSNAEGNLIDIKSITAPVNSDLTLGVKTPGRKIIITTSVEIRGGLTLSGPINITLDYNSITNSPIDPLTGRLLLTTAPIGSGLFLGADHLGYYVGGVWKTYMDNAGNFYLGGTSGALQWNGTTLAITGSITATTGSIGGWDIGTDYIRDVANSTGMASTVTGGNDVRFWAGSTFAARSTAPFRVYEAGDLYATSGNIAGFTIGAAALTAGSGSTVVQLYAGTGTIGLSIGQGSVGDYATYANYGIDLYDTALTTHAIYRNGYYQLITPTGRVSAYGASSAIYFGASEDVNIYRSAADILTTDDLFLTTASTTTRAGLRLPHGAAPTSPVNGDIWTTTAGLYVRINGVTIGPLS